MWRNTTDLSLRRIGDSSCVCERFPLQFSSVVLIQRITPDWTILSWTLPLKPCHHKLCILHPSSLSLSLHLLYCSSSFYSPSLASPAHCVFRSASVFLSTEDNHIPEEGRHMAGKRHTLLSVRLYVPMCVCVAWTITPIVFPEGWANKQGVGIKRWGGVRLKRKKQRNIDEWVWYLENVSFSPLIGRVTGVHVSL